MLVQESVWKMETLFSREPQEENVDEWRKGGRSVGSPEAGNKFLTEKYGLGLDCVIDDRSDVFQLGKLICSSFSTICHWDYFERGPHMGHP